jgi:hypothetical protein
VFTFVRNRVHVHAKYAPLATDLSVLLCKEESEPFPWVIDIFDLEAFFDAWNYFNWKPCKFCEYLNQREKLQGTIVSSDELELAGYFIRHGTFKEITGTKARKIVLDSSYSDVFDEIYRTKYGGEEVKYQPKKPFMTDSREMMREVTKGKDLKEEMYPKLGVNALCFCNSGRKYKRCHGGRG